VLVEKKGARSLTYRFSFYRVEGGSRKLAARGRITAACVERQPGGGFKTVPLPAALGRAIEEAPAEALAEAEARPGNPPPARETILT
jgi:acyl-CoA thioesterase FadM